MAESTEDYSESTGCCSVDRIDSKEPRPGTSKAEESVFGTQLIMPGNGEDASKNIQYRCFNHLQ